MSKKKKDISEAVTLESMDENIAAFLIRTNRFTPFCIAA